MILQRVWAMPTGDTFSCKPIGELVKSYLNNSVVSVDPFARNKRWATWTNDLNPDTEAEYHLDAYDFILMLIDKGVEADCIIFDPPYSPRQIKELYSGIGQTFTQQDAHRTFSWTKEKDALDKILVAGGYFLYFGWDTVGMGKSRGYETIEFLDVCHGPGHHDTLCLVERKLDIPKALF